MVATWVIPVAGDYRLTSSFGDKGPHWETYHTGQDFAAQKGTAVVAAGAGIVSSIDTNHPAYGKRIIITHANGTQTTYNHLNVISVSRFAPVKAGQRIGTVGETGNTTGPHLHFEMMIGGRFVDPMKYMGEQAPEETPTVPGTDIPVTPVSGVVTDPNTWLRIAYFMGGVVFLILGAVAIKRGGLK